MRSAKIPLTGDKGPAVTIAMPVHDAASTIALAMRSILLQSFTDWELLVLDDGSQDRTVDTVRRRKEPAWSWHRTPILRTGPSSRVSTRPDQLHLPIDWHIQCGIEYHSGCSRLRSRQHFPAAPA